MRLPSDMCRGQLRARWLRRNMQYVPDRIDMRLWHVQLHATLWIAHVWIGRMRRHMRKLPRSLDMSCRWIGLQLRQWMGARSQRHQLHSDRRSMRRCLDSGLLRDGIALGVVRSQARPTSHGL